MLVSVDDLVNLVLRSALLSNEIYDDSTVDTSYPPSGFQRPPAETADSRVSYLRFFLEHATDFAEALDALADDRSRELMLSLILFRILGYRRAKIAVDPEPMDVARLRSDALTAERSSLQVTEPEEGAPRILHFEVPRRNGTVKVDCFRANVLFTFFLRQYYFCRAGVAIGPAPGDVAIDGGACFGDTALDFAVEVGESGQVHSFEILASHLDIVRFNLRQNPPLSNIRVYPCGLSDRNVAGRTGYGEPNPGYSIPADGGGIGTRTLDSLVKDQSIRRVDFLKMDMEGSEMAALRGAAQTIRKFRPKLAISIYHSWEDYFTIPRFIRDLRLGYRMYLENYTRSDGETVLYAA